MYRLRVRQTARAAERARGGAQRAHGGCCVCSETIPRERVVTHPRPVRCYLGPRGDALPIGRVLRWFASYGDGEIFSVSVHSEPGRRCAMAQTSKKTAKKR